VRILFGGKVFERLWKYVESIFLEDGLLTAAASPGVLPLVRPCPLCHENLREQPLYGSQRRVSYGAVNVQCLMAGEALPSRLVMPDMEQGGVVS